MTAVIILSVLVYLIITLFLGVLAKRRNLNTSEDYFLAGRKVSWFHLGLTIFATWFSTFAFLGAPGFFYKKGVEWFFVQGSFLLIAPLLSWFIGRKIWLLGRARGYVTPGDMLADFYKNNSVRTLTAIISVLALIPYSLIQFVGIGKVIASSTQDTVPYSTGVILAMAATAFYSVVGGVRAIIWTDLLQGLLFLSVIAIGAGVAIAASGGIEAGFAASMAARPEASWLNMDNIGSPLSLIMIWSFGFVLLPHLWQRSYMAKSAMSLSKSIVLFSALSLVLTFGVMLMGTLGIGFFPAVSDSDNFVSVLFQQYAPWALPLLVLAAFAAGMSTVDSQLLTASSVIVRDLTQAALKRKLSSSQERRLGRIVVLGLILFLGIIALVPESQGAIIPLASKGTGIALLLLVPLCGPLLLKRASREAALSSLVIGALVLFVLETDLIELSIPLGFKAPVIAFLAQALVFFPVSAFQNKTEAAKNQETEWAGGVSSPLVGNPQLRQQPETAESSRAQRARASSGGDCHGA